MKKFTGLFLLAALCIVGIFLYFGLNNTDDGSNIDLDETQTAYENEEDVVDKRNDRDDFAFTVADLTKEFDKELDLEEAAMNPYYSRRLIVMAKEEVDLSVYGAVKVVYGPEYISVMQFDEPEKAEETQQELENLPQIISCEPDIYIEADSSEAENTAEDNDTAYMSWGVAAIGADDYAKRLKDKSDEEIKVAVVDSGVYAHSFLKKRLLSGIDYVDGDTDPDDENSHGTHVAGTIVDCTPELNVKILPVRCLDATGHGTSFAVGMGIYYAADHGADVINLSLGGAEESAYIESSIRYAIGKDSTVVAAAGNNNDDTAKYCPACMEECIVVAALDSRLSRMPESNYGQSVDVIAPGVDIKSCVPKYAFGCVSGKVDGEAEKTGTSMAAPHISAIAAMMKLEDPSRTPQQIEKLIQDSAEDLGEMGWDQWFGYGIPDLSSDQPAENPDKSENGKELDLGIYEEVLAEYKQAAEQTFNHEVVGALEYVNEGAVNFSGQEGWKLVYQYIDLAQDGEPELVIAMLADYFNPYAVIDIYGSQDDRPVRLTENNNSIGYRTLYYICNDGRIKEKGSGGALNSMVNYYKVPAYDTALEKSDSYTYDGWSEVPSYTYADAAGIISAIPESEYLEKTSESDVKTDIDWEVLYG